MLLVLVPALWSTPNQRTLVHSARGSTNGKGKENDTRIAHLPLATGNTHMRGRWRFFFFWNRNIIHRLLKADT